MFVLFFFFQAEDGIRDLVRSRGLGDVYKRQVFVVRQMNVDPGAIWAQVRQANPLFLGVALTLWYLSLIHI